jgi:penicillin amidase
VLRWLLIGCAVLVLAALGAVGSVVWLGKRAEPAYNGEVALAGLTAPVDIRFGPHAVPSIDAETLDDALFAQGYVVASERLWQMDLLRRLAGGRLAEVFGEAALPADRFFRTVGLPRAAEEAFAALEPEYRRLLVRYAEGVNAHIQAAAGRLPLEYRIAGFAPTPWRPADSLAIGEYMAWINSVNLREELTFLRLAERLGNARALELFPVDVGVPPPEDAARLPDYRSLVVAADAEPAMVGLVSNLILRGGASNVWAVQGGRTTDGGALLANDPHLGPSAPAIWYELELEAPGLHVAGLALPGVPLVLIGHNQDLAWGMTTVTADTQDVFIERLDRGARLESRQELGRDGESVLRPGGLWETVQERMETIPVKERPEPELLRIRSTSNGVLIDDVIGADNPDGLPTVRVAGALALRRNLDVPGRAIAALWRINTAKNVDEARAAGSDLRHVSQNLVVADRHGNIGWQVTGTLPRRGAGSGMLPLPGWEAGFAWQGWLPFAANPGVTNPPNERIVNANNRSVPVDASVPVGHSWLPPYRAQRIEEMLDLAGPLDAASMARMQADRDSIRARVFMASLRGVLPELRDLDPAAARIAERSLLHWRGDFPPDSRPAALFGLLVPALYRGLYGDELGEDLGALMALENNTYGPLDEALRSGRSSFWDDVRTPAVQEGLVHLWRTAVIDAEEGLNEILPDGPQRVDRLRSVVFSHAFSGQPLLGRWFEIGPVGLGGDSATVNVANASTLAPRQIGYIPSMRVVYTPADWSQTRGTLPLGQSGHRFSRFRADQLDDWLAVEAHPWPWNGPPKGQEQGALRLLPASTR